MTIEIPQHEHVSNHESEKTSLTHDLMHLSMEEKENLTKRVEKWKGIVRIFVHPMFEKWRGHEPKYINDPEKPKLFAITKAIANFASMDPEKTPPIIILEEQKYLETLSKWLDTGIRGQFGIDQKNDIYVCETLYSKADPITEKDKGLLDTSQTYKERWDPLRDLLDEIGVKKVLLGGIKLKVQASKDGIFYNHCVGTTITELSKTENGRLDMELSALAHPHSRIEANEVKNTKQ